MIALTIGFILDIIIGDPHNPVHPVRIIGGFSKCLESRFRKLLRKRLVFAGALTWIFAVLGTLVVTRTVTNMFYSINFIIGTLVEGIIIYFCISSKGLMVEGLRVINSLRIGNIDKAREQLAYIVGRDTKSLNDIGIIRAVIETVSENMADGIIAPLIFASIGGAPLAMMYKAVNTCDSMFGYKNDKYRDFGYVSAKMDDLFNLIPARITAYLIIVASFILRLDYRGSYRIYKRDRYNHLSPNSAHPEAAVAGSLGVRFGGVNYYFGKPVEKPTIGDDIMVISVDDVDKTNNILMVVSFLGYLIGMGICYFGGIL
ncbi:MAG: adenosylcobinamide-phosphate synthase CbiB [Clostridium sp.]